MENLNQFKFFIVEDDVFCTNVFEQHLVNMNYKDITCFSNGSDCLKNLNQIPDIILLDHNMDGITGFEVLKKIKRYNPNIFVIMISSQASITLAVDALKYGAFDYIVKDQSVCDKLAANISKIISVKAALRKANPSIFQRVLSVF